MQQQRDRQGLISEVYRKTGFRKMSIVDFFTRLPLEGPDKQETTERPPVRHSSLLKFFKK